MKVILRYGNYALIDREVEYIVACNYDESTGRWGHGIYFSHWNHSDLEKVRMFSKAMECFRIKVDKEYVSRSRLEEIATDCIYALIEDDRETALEYFKQELDLTEDEYKYFGINRESEEK